jgi:glycosyltransferase involved in cell wall biosynthesis
MRIGIDSHFAEKEGTGNCTYTRNLIEVLVLIDKKNDYIFYAKDGKHDYYKTFIGRHNVKIRSINVQNSILRISLLGLCTFFDKIEVLHMQYMAPVIHLGRLVVTIHDVSFIFFPSCFSKIECLRLKALIPLNILMAKKVITVSLNSKKDIETVYSLSKKKVVAIYNGIVDKTDLLNQNEFIDPLVPKEKYILFVGRIDARKNLLTAVEAFAILKKTNTISHVFVIVGREDYLGPEIKRKIKDLHVLDIRFTGYVTESSLIALYRSADFLIYPTLYEGFGLPCLEAMTYGCPVISSKNSSISEVVGDAGVLVNPESKTEICDAMLKVISDTDFRTKLVRAGKARSKEFSWTRTARETLDIYENSY